MVRGFVVLLTFFAVLSPIAGVAAQSGEGVEGYKLAWGPKEVVIGAGHIGNIALELQGEYPDGTYLILELEQPARTRYVGGSVNGDPLEAEHFDADHEMYDVCALAPPPWPESFGIGVEPRSGVNEVIVNFTAATLRPSMEEVRFRLLAFDDGDDCIATPFDQRAGAFTGALPVTILPSEASQALTAAEAFLDQIPAALHDSDEYEETFAPLTDALAQIEPLLEFFIELQVKLEDLGFGSFNVWRGLTTAFPLLEAVYQGCKALDFGISAVKEFLRQGATGVELVAALEEFILFPLQSLYHEMNNYADTLLQTMESFVSTTVADFRDELPLVDNAETLRATTDQIREWIEQEYEERKSYCFCKAARDAALALVDEIDGMLDAGLATLDAVLSKVESLLTTAVADLLFEALDTLIPEPQTTYEPPAKMAYGDLPEEKKFLGIPGLGLAPLAAALALTALHRRRD